MSMRRCAVSGGVPIAHKLTPSFSSENSGELGAVGFQPLASQWERQPITPPQGGSRLHFPALTNMTGGSWSASLSFGLLWAAVLGKIPEPQNPIIHLVQWKRVLTWNPSSFQDGLLTYSVQKSFERGDNRTWIDTQKCTHITKTECELLDSLTSHAPYDLRVKAEHGSETSNWVEAVSTPKNVTVDSYNMKHIVKWNPDVLQLGPVTYSVQFQGNFERTTKENWTEVFNCASIAKTECDLLDSLAFFAKYYLRVRTEHESATSEWVEAKPFCPYKDTVIGPPSVSVMSDAGVLHVTISDPVHEDGRSLRFYFQDLAYIVFYWEKNENDNIHNLTTRSSTVLLDLQPWTTYCLRVQAFLAELSKQTLPSQVSCYPVTANAKRRAKEAAQILFITLLAVFVITLGCFLIVIYSCRTVKYLIYPSYRLPMHIKEYLTEPSQHPGLPVLHKNDLQEDHWDKLSIVSRSEITSGLLNSTKADETKMDQDISESVTKAPNERQSSDSSVDSGHYSDSTQGSFHKNSQNIDDALKT
ncbi:interleukin-10 receptor subunit beta-like [Narcine bancroftii]|uniref:interleukin-10 receptor subunit beta-like n=1 Tax=Narcine bancroftii TaxID=1343680 RepID=UPI00383200B2